MDRVLERTRANIVSKQIAAGREFSGQPFYSKPDVIHFKVRLNSNRMLCNFFTFSLICIPYLLYHFFKKKDSFEAVYDISSCQENTLPKRL